MLINIQSQELYSPYRIARYDTTSEEHPYVDRSSLDYCSDRDHNTHDLHETNATQPVSKYGLGQGTNSFPCNIYGNDLGMSVNYFTRGTSGALTAPVRPLDGWFI